MATETELGSDRAEHMGPKTSGRASARLWVAAGLTLIAFWVDGADIPWRKSKFCRYPSSGTAGSSGEQAVGTGP